MRDELEHFVQWCNGEHTPLAYDDTADFYRTEIDKSFTRQFTDKEEEAPRDTLRVSSLGKPCVLQALKILGYHEPAPERKMRFIFHMGDLFEAYITLLAKVYGFNVLAAQDEVDLLGVKGHIDFILENPATLERCLIEVKTMSGSYWNKFNKKIDDTRGYLTQGAVYQNYYALPFYWLIMDKSRNQVHLVEPEYQDFEKALTKARRIIPLLRGVTTFPDVLASFKAPPAVPEYAGRGQDRHRTGNYTMVESMMYSSFREVFYHIEVGRKYGNDIEYVTGYKTADEAQETLEKMYEWKNTLNTTQKS